MVSGLGKTPVLVPAVRSARESLLARTAKFIRTSPFIPERLSGIERLCTQALSSAAMDLDTFAIARRGTTKNSLRWVDWLSKTTSRLELTPQSTAEPLTRRGFGGAQ